MKKKKKEKVLLSVYFHEHNFYFTLSFNCELVCGYTLISSFPSKFNGHTEPSK